MNIVDPKTGKVIWRGVCEARIIVNISEEEKVKRIDYAIRRLLEQFPPLAKKSGQ